jgi:hypothetical protein
MHACNDQDFTHMQDCTLFTYIFKYKYTVYICTRTQKYEHLRNEEGVICKHTYSYISVVS